MTPLRNSFAFCLLGFAVTATASAQDGGQLFTLYCSACHGADGKGAGDGAFPPLAGSPWLAGDADRAIKVVLHGIAGPLEVAGKSYNLEMPPQGESLPDDQIAAILTYVRSAWGNKAPAVSRDLVKSVRAATVGRTEHWTAAEILKLHPLDEAPPVEDLISHVYTGKWSNLPDFEKLKPEAVEEEHGGLISLGKLGKVDKRKNLGIVWEGSLVLPADGEYDFLFAADDGGRLVLDGMMLAEVTGAGPAMKRKKECRAKFSAGPHKLRVEYYDLAGQKEIHVAWRKKGGKDWIWLSDRPANDGKKWPAIILSPSKGRPVIYRNFITGTTARAIGVGFPGGVNMAYSGDHLAPELIWTGAFIDAGHHWTNRGQGSEPPAGNNVVKLTTKPALPPEARSIGYELDPAGNPAFLTEVGTMRLHDAYRSASPTGLNRTITVTGNGDSANSLTLVEGVTVKSVGSDAYEIDGKLTMTVKSAELIDGKTLVLPLVPGASTAIHYSWK